MVFSQDTETGKEKTSKFYLARDIEEAVKLREDKHWALKAEMWTQVLAVPSICCLILGKLPNFSKSQSPHP